MNQNKQNKKNDAQTKPKLVLVKEAPSTGRKDVKPFKSQLANQMSQFSDILEAQIAAILRS